ncbi:MAG TPA: acyltransferase [Gemmatimonadaceae bacterium]|nr:acyltransferase [Gemmatimonadaceae bacterium]
MKAAQTKQRLPGLDVLRGLAVISVLFTHVHIASSTPVPVKQILGVLQHGGWVGVDLFFVLSGFLVSSLLFVEYERYGSLRAGRFLLRRGLKIYPAFYAMLLVTLLYGALRWRAVTPGSFIVEALFVQNYFPFIWPHTWSLAVEEHFYLLLTVGVMILAQRGRDGHLPGREAFRRIVPAYFVIAAFCMIARALTYWAATSAGKPAYFVATHLRFDELLFGVTLSYLWAFDGDRLRDFVTRHQSVLAVAVSVAVPFLFLDLNQQFTAIAGFLLLALTFGTLVLLLLVRKAPFSRLAAVIGRVGLASYSIYLWHIPWSVAVPHIMNRLGISADAWFVPLATYLIGSLIVGMTAAAVIELPVLRLRDRLLPSRTGKPVTAQAAEAVPALSPRVDAESAAVSPAT